MVNIMFRINMEIVNKICDLSKLSVEAGKLII